MKLTIVFDADSENCAIYIDGVCRGNWSEKEELTISEFILCYDQYVEGPAVIIEKIDVHSNKLGIFHDDEFGQGVDWPEQLGNLFRGEVNASGQHE